MVKSYSINEKRLAQKEQEVQLLKNGIQTLSRAIEEKTEENVKSGWIYILKSKSRNPEISSLKDLYKIGLSTSNVPDRIKNALNEATYLFADLDMWQLINVII